LVLRHEDLPDGHEHVTTRIKKAAGHGFVVMTNHIIRQDRIEDEALSANLYTSTFEGRYYLGEGAPSEVLSLEELEVTGPSNFDLTMAVDGDFTLVYEDIQLDVKKTLLTEINKDFMVVSNVQVLNAAGDVSSEALPVILARADGTYIHAVTKIPDDFLTSRRQPLRGGIIQSVRIGGEIPKLLSIEDGENNMYSIWFQTTQGKTYRLFRARHGVH
jgi:hypothetical protein